MKILEITEAIISRSFDHLYHELPGTRGNWAPYVVRRLVGPDGVEAFAVFQQGHRVASATLSRDRTYVSDLSVLPEHRRRGIATALYRFIEDQIGQRLTPSPLHQTDSGKAFWNSRKPLAGT